MTPSLEDGLPKDAAAWEAPEVVKLAAKPAGFRRRRVLVGFALAGALLLVLGIVSWKSIEWSFPEVEPRRLVVDGRAGREKFTMSLDAGYKEPTAAWHRFALGGAQCDVTVPCFGRGGNDMCPALRVKIDPARGDVGNSFSTFSAELVQAWPDGVRDLMAELGTGAMIACDAVVIMDVLKTGLEVTRTLRFVTDFTSDGEPTLELEKKKISATPPDGLTGSATVSASLMMHLGLPATSKVAEVLKRVRTTVMADFGYVEMKEQAVEGHLHIHTDLNVTTDGKTGVVMVSAPFSLSARADIGPILRIMQAASRPVPMEPGSGGDGSAVREGSSGTTVEIVPAPHTDGAMMLLGGSHKFQWDTTKVEAVTDGAKRRLAVDGSGLARRLVDAMSMTGGSFRTSHRIRMDGEDFLGIDVAAFEGPPFEFKAVFFTRSRGEDIDCNISLQIDSALDTAMARVGCMQTEWLEANWQLNASFMVDAMAETLGFNISMDSAKGDGRLMVNELTSIKDSKMNFGMSLDFNEHDDATFAVTISRATNGSCTKHVGAPASSGGPVSHENNYLVVLSEPSLSVKYQSVGVRSCQNNYAMLDLCTTTDESVCSRQGGSDIFQGFAGQCVTFDHANTFYQVDFECGTRPHLGRFDVRVNIDGVQEQIGFDVMFQNGTQQLAFSAGLSDWSNDVPYRVALSIGGNDVLMMTNGTKDGLHLRMALSDVHGNFTARRVPATAADPHDHTFEMMGCIGADSELRMDKLDYNQQQAAAGAREVWNVTMDGHAELRDTADMWELSARGGLEPHYAIIGGALSTDQYVCCDAKPRNLQLYFHSSGCEGLDTFMYGEWVAMGYTADGRPYYRRDAYGSVAFLFYDPKCWSDNQMFNNGWIMSTVPPNTTLQSGRTGGYCPGVLAAWLDQTQNLDEFFSQFNNASGWMYFCGDTLSANHYVTGILKENSDSPICPPMSCSKTVIDLENRVGVDEFKAVVTKIAGTDEDKHLEAHLTFSEGADHPRLAGDLRKVTGGWNLTNLQLKKDSQASSIEILKGFVTLTDTTLAGGATRLGVAANVQVSDGNSSSQLSQVVVEAHVTDNATYMAQSVYVHTVIDNEDKFEAYAGKEPHHFEANANVSNGDFKLMLHIHEDFDVSGNFSAKFAVGNASEDHVVFFTDFLNKEGWGGLLRANLSGSQLDDAMRANVSFFENAVAKNIALNLTSGTPGEPLARANISLAKPGADIPFIDALLHVKSDQVMKEMVRFHTHVTAPDYAFGVEGATRQIMLLHPVNFTATLTIEETTNVSLMLDLRQVGTAVKGGFNFSVDGEKYLEANVSSDTATPAGKLSLGFGVAVRVDEAAKVTNFRLKKYEGNVTNPWQCYGDSADLFREVFIQQEIVVSEECMYMPYYSGYSDDIPSPFVGAYFKIDECSSTGFAISYGCDGNCQNCVQDGKPIYAGQCNQLDQWGSGIFVANWNCSDPPPEFVPLFAGEGKLTQSGDWQSGTITMSSDGWTQAFQVNASRGFLVQPQKTPGYYDAMYLSVATLIEGDKANTSINLTRFRIERSPNVTVSNVGWMVDVVERYTDGHAHSVYSQAFDLSMSGWNHSDVNHSRMLPVPGNWSRPPATMPYCPAMMLPENGQVLHGTIENLCNSYPQGWHITFHKAPNATRVVTASCLNCCQWNNMDQVWTIIDHDPSLFESCSGFAWCENANCNGPTCPNVVQYNASDGESMLRACHYDQYDDPRDATCQGFYDRWEQAKCHPFEFQTSKCNGVELTMVKEKCDNRGCQVHVGFGMRRRSCNDYCHRHGLQCLKAFAVDTAHPDHWCSAGAFRGCERNFMADEAVCECTGFGDVMQPPPPYENRTKAIECLNIIEAYEGCLSQFRADEMYVEEKRAPKFIVDHLRKLIGPKKCINVDAAVLARISQDHNEFKPINCTETP